MFGICDATLSFVRALIKIKKRREKNPQLRKTLNFKPQNTKSCLKSSLEEVMVKHFAAIKVTDN